MRDSQRLVLMIQPTRLQGLIWQAVLKSQQLAVIWESPETNLEENLSQLQQAGLALPDLLLVDVRLRNFNPYAFCRWCREHCPHVKVVLVNASKTEIIPSERQWALLQGAAELLPAFDPENLMITVADGVRRVSKVLNDHTLDNGSLVSVLLNIKRELESRRTQKDTSSRNGAKPSESFTNPKDNQTTSKAAQPPLPPLDSKPSSVARNAPTDPAWIEIFNDPSDDEPPAEPPPTRMYRGRKY
jgi:CheY-like chemotaxis protein